MSTVVLWVLLIVTLKSGGTRGIAARHGVPSQSIDGTVSVAGNWGLCSLFCRLLQAVCIRSPAEPVLGVLAALAAITALLALLPVAEYLLGDEE